MKLHTGKVAALGVEGIPGFSQLPKGTLLTISSGAKLIVEAYNPLCLDRGRALVERQLHAGAVRLENTSFFARPSVRVVWLTYFSLLDRATGRYSDYTARGRKRPGEATACEQKGV